MLVLKKISSRIACLFLVPFLLASCQNSSEKPAKSSTSEESVSSFDVGVFLGESSKNVDKLVAYKSVAIDLDEFDQSSIRKLKENNVEIYGYLSIGSLERYRSYYDEFKESTIMPYENWPDEWWMDVTNLDWQEHIKSEANRLSSLGADGLFMDNFDIFYIVNEEFECSETYKQNVYSACKTMLTDLEQTSLKLMINSGTDFLEALHDESSPLLKGIEVYAQECVFSSIKDYENNIFEKQNEEDKKYYLSIVSFMKENSKILFIEYTKDDVLASEIKTYCQNNQYFYHISHNVNLTF